MGPKRDKEKYTRWNKRSLGEKLNTTKNERKVQVLTGAGQPKQALGKKPGSWEAQGDVIPPVVGNQLTESNLSGRFLSGFGCVDGKRRSPEHTKKKNKKKVVRRSEKKGEEKRGGGHRGAKRTQ